MPIPTPTQAPRRAGDGVSARQYEPLVKAPARIIDKQAGTEKLMHEGCCRLCGHRPHSGLGLTRHHLIPRIKGGDDVDDNLVPLCGDGTRGCHSDVEHWRAMARERLRRVLTPAEKAYVNRRAAELGCPGYLDTAYPWG